VVGKELSPTINESNQNITLTTKRKNIKQIIYVIFFFNYYKKYIINM